MELPFDVSPSGAREQISLKVEVKVLSKMSRRGNDVKMLTCRPASE